MSLVQPEQNRAIACTLLAVDRQRSPLHAFTAAQQQALAFSAYGMRNPPTTPLTALGFTGEPQVAATGHYLLGNGYRAFNPVLMRFNSPDALSPFGRGGLNSYAYCAGDPVNRVDPAGKTWSWLKTIMRRLGVMRPAAERVPASGASFDIGSNASTSGGSVSSSSGSQRSGISVSESTMYRDVDDYAAYMRNGSITSGSSGRLSVTSATSSIGPDPFEQPMRGAVPPPPYDASDYLRGLDPITRPQAPPYREVIYPEERFAPPRYDLPLPPLPAQPPPYRGRDAVRWMLHIRELRQS